MISRAPSLLFAFLASTALATAEALPDDWAFRPLKQVLVPRPPAQASTNPVDLFLTARLAQDGSTRRPPADPRVLIRRVYFDLIGLPPAPEEVEAFLRDKRPGAFERVVDRLLASPQYGERWARHWLDVVRFGESQGFEYDRIRDHAWRYRDYVIAAFNADKPYHQFIREQLAGDVTDPVTQEGVVATGFLVAGPWDQAGNSSASPSVRAMVREAELEDMLGTIGQTFLGVTLNCARCHNHKFDPIPTRDYYRIKAVFQGVRHGERSLLTKEEEATRATEVAARKKQLGEVEQRLTQIESTARTRAAKVGQASSLSRTNRSSRLAVDINNHQNASDDTGTGRMPVLPLARWTFETNAQDSVGSTHARLEGGARLAQGRLALDGKEAFAVTEPLKLPLRERTLEAWVALTTLDQSGGGVVSVEFEEGKHFDAIVFAERQPRRWMAGSEFYRRTRDLEDAPDETTARGQLVHVAVVHQRDHTVTVFRNGRPYGQPYRWTGEADAFDTFPAGRTRLLFGKRHTGGSNAMLAGEIEEARLYDQALSEAQIAISFQAGPEVFSIPPEQLATFLTETERRERERLRTERDRLAAPMGPSASPMGYVAKPEKTEATFVLHRGESDKPREQVVAGALSAVTTPASDIGCAAETPEAERRRRFADWIVSPDNPLTARTIVNRVWHYHFGRGLVATPNDLGKMGERPADPELLDWLAGWFVSRNGANWSLKKLHRLIVTSETWRSASESVISRSVVSGRQTTGSAPTDLLNTDSLITSFRAHRLEAEVIRDAMLAVSGELNPQMGGPGFRPFRHVGSGGQNEYFASDPVGPEFNRRTIYRICVHSARDPLLDSLDCPEFSTRTASRPSTTTPLQALSLMNNSFVQRQAKKLAERIEREVGADPKAQVKSLWLRCYSREPRPDELRAATKLARDEGLPSVAWAVLNSNEFVFVR